jgi:rhodanese-related sulfurtransferase
VCLDTGGKRRAVALQDLGYNDVATLEGGYAAWKAAGLPTVGD